jgi:hypothetical protein
MMEAYNLNYIDYDVWNFIEYYGGGWWYYCPEIDHQILYEYNGFLTEC